MCDFLAISCAKWHEYSVCRNLIISNEIFSIDLIWNVFVFGTNHEVMVNWTHNSGVLFCKKITASLFNTELLITAVQLIFAYHQDVNSAGEAPPPLPTKTYQRPQSVMGMATNGDGIPPPRPPPPARPNQPPPLPVRMPSTASYMSPMDYNNGGGS